MQSKNLLWPGLALVSIISLCAFGAAWGLNGFFRDLFVSQSKDSLGATSKIIDSQIPLSLEAAETFPLSSLCDPLKVDRTIRVTVIALSGKVLCDSQSDSETMDNHANRPEFIEAAKGQLGLVSRFSSTLGHEVLYLATPLVREERTIAILRLAQIRPPTRAIFNESVAWVALVGLVALIGAALTGMSIYKKLLLSARRITQNVLRLSQGDLDFKVAPVEQEILTPIVDSLNTLSERMKKELTFLREQLGQQELVLLNMLEGVLVIDRAERVLSINPAACQLLGLSFENSIGRTVTETLRNFELQSFLDRLAESNQPMEEEIILPLYGNDSYVSVYGRPLLDSAGSQLGLLIVLNDITRLRHLEKIRTEFVANVSHELKTPVTSIKGFVETLLDGAIDNPEDARRFLQIIAKQTERLNAIFDDLLSLSRIEQQRERSELSLSSCSIGDLLELAVNSCQLKAIEKQIDVKVDCPKNICALINSSLLEQAVVNLINNALEFSEAKSTVIVGARQTQTELTIFVKDQGCGIDKLHLPRIFERFYRVDDSRSRKQGGTGLGLAIVKHIAHVHGGQTSVESILGKGSTFYIKLPAQESISHSKAAC